MIHVRQPSRRVVTKQPNVKISPQSVTAQLVVKGGAVYVQNARRAREIMLRLPQDAFDVGVLDVLQRLAADADDLLFLQHAQQHRAGPYQPPSPSTAEKIEDGYVASDQNPTRLAVLENTGVVEVTVQGAQDFGSANHGGMHDRVVVRI